MASFIYVCLFLTLPFNFSYAQSENKFFRKDYHYIETVESFYKIQTIYSSWQDAKQICEAEGASLFYPKNEEEFNAVNTFVKDTEGSQYGIWVDLSKSPNERNFKTSDGFELGEVYNIWGMSEPNGAGHENCLVLSYRGDLSDWICATKKPFICKKTLASLKVNSQSNTTTDRQREQNFFRRDYHYMRSVKNFYKINTVSNIWVDAKERCEWEGTTLYYPTSEVEAEAVLAYAKETQGFNNFWIGITSLLSEGVLLTIDGLSMTEVYNKWNPGEPNDVDGVENCVENIESGLNDIKCDRKLHYICKKKLASLEWNTACQMPYSDYKYNETLGKCYKLHTSPKKWTEAYAICSSELSYLAVIDSHDEADFFVDIITNNVPEDPHGNYLHGIAHLGFHNKFGHGWRTVKDTPLQHIEYLFWGEGQSDDSEACGGMFFNGQLGGFACDKRCFFICEHDV